jgi:prophage endopeptidase
MKLLISLLIALAGFGAGWASNGWRLGEEVQSLKTQHEKTIADAEHANNMHLIALVNEHDAKAARLAAIDQETTDQLTKAQHENKTLAARLAAGTVGLRIAATCPASAPGGPEAAQGTGVGAGASATLDATAGRAYSALREGIATTEGKLTACQRMLAEFSP